MLKYKISKISKYKNFLIFLVILGLIYFTSTNYFANTYFYDSVSLLKIFKFFYYYFLSMFIGFFGLVYHLGIDSTIEEKKEILHELIGYPESEEEWKEFNHTLEEFRPSFWEKVSYKHGSPISFADKNIIFSGPIGWGLSFPFVGFFTLLFFLLILFILFLLTYYVGTNYLGLNEIEGIRNGIESIIIGKPM